jgi:5-methylcytosine-specific restriction endonuclease McrA
MFYYKELSMQEGFDVLSEERNLRNVDGIKVSAPSGYALWKECNDTNRPIVCFCCGAVADRWIVKHQHNDREKPPVVELFAFTEKKRLVMMTRDHIIPRSWGGLDLVANLRPACEPCNRERKNNIDEEDMRFMAENPHLRNDITPRDYNNEKVSDNKKSNRSPPNRRGRRY